MTSHHRGAPRIREDRGEEQPHRPLRSFAGVASNKNQEVVLSAQERREHETYRHHKHIQHRRRKTKPLSELASPCRSSTAVSDNATLVTEGTGVSTLTSGSGERQRYNHHHHLPRSRTGDMISTQNYTIYEDELQMRAVHSPYISRPIDVDSMQEYEDDDEDVVVLKPHRDAHVDHDDSRSRTTASTYSSRPIDVDSLMEYTSSSYSSSRPIDVDSVMEFDPEEYPESRLPEERFQKIMNFNGYYEGESLLEYSSEDDESVDFETGVPSAANSGRDAPEPRVARVRRLQSPADRVMTRISVDLVGPIHVDTTGKPVCRREDDASEASLRDNCEFPVLDERDFDRELVGYMAGFEPFVEGLPSSRPPPSDTASAKSSNTRVTFEI